MEKKEILGLGQKFPLKYNVELGEFKRVLEDKATWTTADAVIFIPIIRENKEDPNKGKKVFSLFSVDGKFKTAIPDFELLESILFAVSTLSKSNDLKDWHTQLLSQLVKDFEDGAKSKGEFKTV